MSYDIRKMNLCLHRCKHCDIEIPVSETSLVPLAENSILPHSYKNFLVVLPNFDCTWVTGIGRMLELAIKGDHYLTACPRCSKINYHGWGS